MPNTQLEQLQESIETKTLSPEQLKLLVAIKKKNRLEKGASPYRCIVISICSTSAVGHNLSIFMQKLQEHYVLIPNNRHFQIIIYLEKLKHYFTLHVQKIDGHLQWLILDAANVVADFQRRADTPLLSLYTLLMQYSKQIPYLLLPKAEQLEHTLQNDDQMCPIFALQQSHIISLYDNVFSYFACEKFQLKTWEGLSYKHVTYQTLPLELKKLLLLSQTRSLCDYLKSDPEIEKLKMSSKKFPGEDVSTAKVLYNYYYNKLEKKNHLSTLYCQPL